MEWYERGVAWDPFGFGGTNNGETCVDLRLGKTSNSVQKQVRAVSKSVSSSSSSSSSSKPKRSRVYYKAKENAKCSVDGCEDELKDCRDYHRRHRVCEMHSKTAVVLIKGIQQRFCQQCSRFHSLDEFDDFKRSCRRRLEGHNRRRRKPHPRPLLFSSDCSGPRLLQFGSPDTDIYGKAYLSMWHGPPKAKAEPMSNNNGCHLDQQSLVSAFANIQNLQDRQVPVLQPSGNEAVYQQIHGTTTASEAAASGNSYQKMSPDSALYLLSALQTPTSEFGVVESSMSCPTQLQVQPPLGHIHFDGADKCSSYSRRVMSEASDPTWTLLEADTPNLHCNGDEGSLTFPFSWY